MLVFFFSFSQALQILFIERQVHSLKKKKERSLCGVALQGATERSLCVCVYMSYNKQTRKKRR